MGTEAISKTCQANGLYSNHYLVLSAEPAVLSPSSFSDNATG